MEALYPEAIRLVVDDRWMIENGITSCFKHVPHDAADDQTHRHFTAWLCQTVLGETVDVIFTSEDYADAFDERRETR